MKIYQNSQENTCARVSFLLKLQAWYSCFSLIFEKFLRPPFFTEHLRVTTSVYTKMLIHLIGIYGM